MSIATTVEQHLARQGIHFDVLDHATTYTASRTAQVSHITGKAVAKAVLLKDEQGYLLAVLPASRQIEFGRLEALLTRKLFLASEEEAAAHFADCEPGALPATGEAYGIPVVVDDNLSLQSEIYFEGGDHHSLLHISGKQFERLMASAQHGHFSSPA